MFGSRPDGVRIRGLSQTREFLPFISPRRNESLVYYSTQIDLEPALAFLDDLNRERSRESRVTFFHLYLRAIALAFHERPGVNRFVAGGRLWQRNHVAISFSAKQEILDGSPVLTLKRIFPRHESLDEMVESMLDDLRSRRKGRETASDKEVKFGLAFPVPVLRLVMWVLHRANMLGLLPASMIQGDPLFTSVFLANLGSVDLDAGYHHLWEYGTCSIFGVLGRIRRNPDGQRVVEVKYSYDERVEDGLYAAITMEGIKESLELPESLR
jgi:hypothetical protein